MRVPHIINRNTLEAYDASQVTLQLLGEIGRKLRAEELFHGDEGPRTLSTLCVQTLAKNFVKYPIINNLLLCSDRDFMLEILPTDLPLTLIVSIIDDEIYWKQRYHTQYGLICEHLHSGWTWKCTYLEHYMQNLIENAHPETGDEDYMEEITTLLNPYCHRLVISQLQSWKPPLNMADDEIPEVYPNDHINLEPIFRRLNNVEEVEMVFSQNKVGANFTWNMFTLSHDDARRLGRALLNLKRLRTLCLHSSNVEDTHVQILVTQLIKINTLQELTISNCFMGDRGALCIAKLMLSHTDLQRLVLCNNRIGKVGGEGIGYALMQPDCCPLKHLNLRLNPLGHEGVMGILRALIRVYKLEELVLSGCGFNDETAIRIGSLLQVHSNLKLLDISNNWCNPGQHAIVDGVMVNSTIQILDLRECDIAHDLLIQINIKLAKNRGYVLEFNDDSENMDEGEDIESILTKQAALLRSSTHTVLTQFSEMVAY